MLLLAIDTSGKQGSIALARAGEPCTASRDVEVMEVAQLLGGTFSAQLVPQIAALLSAHGKTKHDLDGFAVVSGPGSFTGIRIGLAAVKALSEVLSKPIARVSMLEVMAYACGERGKIVTALDAGRGDVYVGEHNAPANGGDPGEKILTRAEFLAFADGKTTVTTDAAIADAARSTGLAVEVLAQISAAEVARLGWQKIRSGDVVTPEQLEANYVRRTDAEILERHRF